MRKALPKNRAQSGQSDQSGVRRAIAAGARGACVAAIAVSTVAGAGLVTGCAVSESDVVRWERTERGPYKLVAVITHDKYSWQLRVDSAISLIRMPARGGRRMGISYLCDHYQDEDGSDKEGALVQLSEDARKKVVDGMIPEMLKAMQTPPPVKKADGTIDADESIPFKDAAYAMLSHEPSLVTDPKAHDELIAALSTWVQTDFENRMENNSQQYGIEQIMHYLGPSSVKSLPTLINETSTKVDKISQLVADIGDADAKQKTADALVALAKRFDSQAWVDKEKPIVQDSDVKGGQKVTPAQLDAQLKQFQDQQMTSTFGSMKRIGTRPIIDYCINYASNANNTKERRQAALAALEGRIDKNNTGDTDKLFAIAKDDGTPDEVRDLAFARLGELPKEIMVPKLYTLFETKKWKVRWVAGTNILKTMSTKDVPDFLKHLPTTPATKAGMTEFIGYGSAIAQMDVKPAPGAPKAKDVLSPYLTTHDLGPKLTAISYYYGGSKGDLGRVTALEGDGSPVPKCDKDDDCGWSCDVPKAPGSQETESKTIVTVGDYVKYCVVPSMTGK
jgi:hypothetical protein